VAVAIDCGAHFSALQDIAAFAVGTDPVLNERFTICLDLPPKDGILGRGTSGVVYNCRDAQSGGLAAVKIARKPPQEIASNKFIFSLEDEKKALEALGTFLLFACFFRGLRL